MYRGTCGNAGLSAVHKRRRQRHQEDLPLKRMAGAIGRKTESRQNIRWKLFNLKDTNLRSVCKNNETMTRDQIGSNPICVSPAA
jgi:hypothetical protein